MSPWTGRDRTREFEEAALVHLDVLYRGALRLTGNRADAEDIVQEALLRAFRSFDRFDPGTNCRAWLFRIMRNVFLNRIRRAPEVPHDDTFFDRPDWPDSPGAPLADAGPEEEFFQTVLHGDVERALRTLPQGFREVVMLADLEGFTYKEVAEALGCPIGTVMSRLHRARRLLRRSLADLARERGYTT